MMTRRRIRCSTRNSTSLGGGWGTRQAKRAEPICMASTQASHVGKIAARGSIKQCASARVRVVLKASPGLVEPSSKPSINCCAFS